MPTQVPHREGKGRQRFGMSISFVMQALKFQDGSPENQPVRKEIPFQEPSFSGYSCYTLGGGIKKFTHDPCDVV